MFLLAEDLKLQEQLLLLQESGVGRVHGRRRLLHLLVWRNVLVVLELLYFWLHIFGLLMSVLVRRLGLFKRGKLSWSVGTSKRRWQQDSKIPNLDYCRNRYWWSYLVGVRGRQAFFLALVWWASGCTTL